MSALSIEERLDRLERGNRRLKILAGAVIVLAGGGLLLAAASGVRAQTPAWRRTVEAEKFVLRDASGKPLAMMDATNEEPTLTLADASGKPRAILGVDADGASLDLWDASGKPSASLGMLKDGPGLVLYDANGNMRAFLDGESDGPSLTLRDSGGFESVVGHVALQAPATGEQSTTSAASIRLFNKAGTVIWSAP